MTRDDELIELLTKAQDPEQTDWNAIQGLLLRFKEDYHSSAGHPDSWFVCDATGRQVARVPSSATSIGRNYAHRDYFHGHGSDGVGDADAGHISDVHRSEVYISSSTGTLRVALTRPIWSQEAVTPEREFLGILGMSVSLGEFRELQTGLGSEQLVMVVDLEQNVMGEESYEGLVLHHPEMESSRGEEPRTIGQLLLTRLREVREQAVSQISQSDSNSWTAELLLNSFDDPWHTIPLTNTHWVAAFSPVLIQGRSPGIADTGWGVIVAEREIDQPGVFGFELLPRDK